MIVETSLLRQQAWLNGEWVDADSGETFAVDEPRHRRDDRATCRGWAPPRRARAIEAAEAALPAWRATLGEASARGSCAAGPT